VRLPAPDQPFAQAVEAAAQAHGLDPKLLHAVVIVESAYRTRAVSPAGAAGLTQLMPATATSLGVRDRFDATANLLGGAAYLAKLLAQFGDLRLALAAYNAGPGRVAALGHVPDIAETRAYVSAVVNCYLALAAGRRLRTSNECRSPEAAP
jgi:soluble lytic murein transglycosylase-like protein